jgi:hypothetical protein
MIKAISLSFSVVHIFKFSMPQFLSPYIAQKQLLLPNPNTDLSHCQLWIASKVNLPQITMQCTNGPESIHV